LCLPFGLEVTIGLARFIGVYVSEYFGVFGCGVYERICGVFLNKNELAYKIFNLQVEWM